VNQKLPLLRKTATDQFTTLNNMLESQNMPNLNNIKRVISKEMKISTPVQIKEPESDLAVQQPNPFGIAVRSFRSKLNKFSGAKLGSGKHVKKHQRVPEQKKESTEGEQQSRKSIHMARTASFSHLDIIKEPSDEDMDMQPGNVLYQAAKNLAAEPDQTPQQGKGLRKNSSQQSLLSMSSMNSSMSKGFWPSNKLTTRSQRSSFNSQIDYVRYVKKSSRQFAGDNALFSKRRAKQNLERDLKWNGPFDEDFFRCYE